MSEAGVEGGQPIIPPIGDIRNTAEVADWMRSNIKRIPKGSEDLKHEDGTPLTLQEQLDTYIKQTTDVIEHLKQKNPPNVEETYQALEKRLLEYAQPDNPTPQPGT